MSQLPAPLIIVRYHALWQLDSLLYLFFGCGIFLLAHGLIFSAFNLGFEDANIPFGPVEGTELLRV
jgi:hypothetical protein